MNDLRNRKSVFGSDYEKLESDKNNSTLKEANTKAKNARQKAEGKYSSDLYQQRMELEKAKAKRDKIGI